MKELLKNSQSIAGVVQAARLIPNDLRRARWVLARRAKIEAYLRLHEVRKLHVGCGRNVLKDWLNADVRCLHPDVVYLDATRIFPLPNDSFSYVFSEHLIDHLDYPTAVRMLQECYRVLKPGGRIRIATPNLLQVVGLACKERDHAQEQYVRWVVDTHWDGAKEYRSAFAINAYFSGEIGRDCGFVFDPETLRGAMESNGFEAVEMAEPSASEDPHFDGIDGHGKLVGEAMSRFETMVMEAIKPAALLVIMHNLMNWAWEPAYRNLFEVASACKYFAETIPA
jgi:SAM-dependent methyltransferase